MFRNPSADVLIVLVIVLLFLGPKRLPGLGRSLGSGIREFKDGITGGSHSDDEDHKELSSSKSESTDAS
jgi:sec-independent protein translocase protein TatA